MKVRDIYPRVWGNRRSHWCINYALIYFFSPINACLLRVLSYKLGTEFFICKLRSKRRVSSDLAGMKNVSAEVSIFCLWTNYNWIHFTTCSKISWAILLQSVSDGQNLWSVHFRSPSTRVENWRTTKLFLKHVS